MIDFERLKKFYFVMGGRTQIPVNKIFPDSAKHRARMHRRLDKNGEMTR